MKVFVSVPMSGRTHEDIFGDQVEAIEYIRTLFPDDVVQLINPHGTVELDEDETDSKHKSIRYLAKDMALIAESDLMVFTGEWWTAHGCLVERKVSTEYRLPVCLLSAPEPQVRCEGPEVHKNVK